MGASISYEARQSEPQLVSTVRVVPLIRYDTPGSSPLLRTIRRMRVSPIADALTATSPLAPFTTISLTLTFSVSS